MPRADRVLEQALASYGVHVLRDARVADLDARRVTVTTPEGDTELDDVAHAHVVPHYRAPRWIAESSLAGDTATGWWTSTRTRCAIAGSRQSGRSATWPTSASGLPAARSASRSPSWRHNILAADGVPLERYDGYTVMPITTARHRLMLVEVDRDGRPVPTVPFPDLVRPRRLTWAVDRYALPVTYFRRILRGKV